MRAPPSPRPPASRPWHPACPPHTRSLARRRSEITSEGKRITRLDSILLNGNNVALVHPPACPTHPSFLLPRPPPHDPSRLTSPLSRGRSAVTLPAPALGSSCLVATRITLRNRCYVRILRFTDLDCTDGPFSDSDFSVGLGALAPLEPAGRVYKSGWSVETVIPWI